MSLSMLSALLLLSYSITPTHGRVHMPLTSPVIFIEPDQPISQLHTAPQITNHAVLTGQHYRSVQPVYSSDLQYSRSHPHLPVNLTNAHPNAYVYNNDGSFNVDYYRSLHNQQEHSGRQLLQSTYIGDTLTGCAGLDFFVSTTIGSQTFLLIVDTGSTTAAVAGANCQVTGTSTACNVSPKYKNSGTDTGSSATNKYGDGTGFSGEVYTDTFAVQGTQAVSLAFVSISSASEGFFTSQDCNGNTPRASTSVTSSNVNQGILGLAYPNLAVKNTQSWFDQYWANAAHTNQAEVFATQLCQTTGRLWIGGVDSNYYTGVFSYVPITSQQYYTVGLNDIGAGTTSSGQSGSAIVDTGTSQITLGPTAYARLVNTIVSSPAWNQYFPNVDASFFTSSNCLSPPSGVSEATLNSALPVMYVSLSGGNGANIKLSTQAISSYLQLWNNNGGSYLCSGLGVNSDESQPVILGYPLLNQFTTLFDRTNSRIGFANAANCGNSGFTTYTGGSGSALGSKTTTTAVAAAVGVLGGLLLLAALYYCCRRRKQQAAINQSNMYIQPATVTTTPSSRNAFNQALIAQPVAGYRMGSNNNSPSSASSNSGNGPQWTQYYASGGQPYWYNSQTRTSQWERPQSVI